MSQRVKARIDNAQRLRKRGSTLQDIANELGCSTSQAQRYVRGTTAWQEREYGEPARRKAARRKDHRIYRREP